MTHSHPARRARRRVSHLSHVGGLLGGLVTSFAFLPNTKDRRFRALRAFALKQFGQRLPSTAPAEHASCWKATAAGRVLRGVLLVVCAGAVVFLFAALPAWLWTMKLPRLACPALPSIV